MTEGYKSEGAGAWNEYEDFPPFVGKRLEKKPPRFTEDEEGDIAERTDFYTKHPESLKDLAGDDEEKLEYLKAHPESIRGEVIRWLKNDAARREADREKPDASRVEDDDRGEEIVVHTSNKRAREGNLFDYYPSRKGEGAAERGARYQWQKEMTRLAEEFPRLREIGEDGHDETEAEWLERVGMKPKEEWIKDYLSEKTREPEDREEEKLSREEMLRVLGAPEMVDWLDGKVASVKELHEMDDEELRGLLDSHKQEQEQKEAEEKAELEEWLGQKGKHFKKLEQLDKEELELIEGWKREESGEKDELSREEMLERLGAPEMVDWLDGKVASVKELREMSDEELRELLRRYEEEKGKKPEALIIANIDVEKDAKEAARDIAHRVLTEKIKGGSLPVRWIKSLVMGKMFRGGFLKRYEKDAYEQILAKQRGEESELSDEDWSRGGSVLETFVTAYVNGYEHEMIHEAAGESMKTYGMEEDENGNKSVYIYENGGKDKREINQEDAGEVAGAEAMRKVHEAVENFAKSDGSKDAVRNFREAVKRIKNDLGGSEAGEELMVDNYLAVAEAARDRVVHEEGIENVMEGFRFINGEARRNVRTEAQLSRVDELIGKWSESKLGMVLSPEVLGTAASVALWAGQRGASTLAGAIMPGVGGLAVAGAMSAAREHRQVSIDQADYNRRRARGEEVGEGKYNAQMEAARYESKPATDLTADLRAAMEAVRTGDDSEAAMEDLAEALAKTDFLVNTSDLGRIDLISFSSGNTEDIVKERMALDVAKAEARVMLLSGGEEESREKERLLVNALTKVSETFETEKEAKDLAFKKLRAKRVAMTAGATVAIGAGIGLGLSEAAALFDPNRVGAIETALNEYTGLNTTNYEGAQNTLLAGALGLKGTRMVDAAAGERRSLSTEEAEGLRSEGYTVKERTVETMETRNVSVSEYAQNNGTPVNRIAWGTNETSYSDGNELGGEYSPNGGGFLLNMYGSSTATNGEVINFNNAVENGQMHVFLSLSGDTQGTPLDIPVNVLPNGQIEALTDDPGIQALIHNRDFAYAEFAYTPGTTTDGAMDMISLATIVGNGGSSGGTLTETIVGEETVYDVFGFEQEAERLMSGSLALPFVGRKELSLGRRAEERSTAEAEASPTLVTEPVPEPVAVAAPEPEPAPDESRPATVASDAATPESGSNWSEEPGSPELNGSEMGTIGYASEDPRFGNISDEALQGIIDSSSFGKRYTIKEVRKAMSDWNASSEEVRRNALTAGYDFNESGPAKILRESGLIDTFEPVNSSFNYGEIKLTERELRYFELDGQDAKTVHEAITQWNRLSIGERARYASDYDNESVPNFVKVLRRASLIQK